MKRLLIAISAIALLASCDRTIHEYPIPTKAPVIIELNVDRNPPKYYKKIEFDKKFKKTVSTMQEDYALPYDLEKDKYLLRISVEVYDERGNTVLRRVITKPSDALAPQDTIHAKLPDGKYRVASFADYVPKDKPEDWHYKTGSLKKIDTDLSTYPKNSHLRDCAAGVEDFIIDFRLTPDGYPALAKDANNVIHSRKIPVYLKRASGRYRITATDYNSYLLAGGKADDIKVKVTYKQYASVGYNVDKQEPNNFKSSYSFITKPDIYISKEKTQISLTIDYILTSNSEENAVIADFIIYDRDKQVSQIMGINIPLKRNHETVLEGYFLTKNYSKDDGIQIDENFDGEYLIKI